MNATLAALWTDAENPAYGTAGKVSATAAAERYARGEPLVRYHRSRPERGWSWLCPEPSCMEWRTAYVTEQHAEVAWRTHAARHPDISPSWPDTSAVVLPKKRRAANAQLDLLVELEGLS